MRRDGLIRMDGNIIAMSKGSDGAKKHDDHEQTERASALTQE